MVPVRVYFCQQEALEEDGILVKACTKSFKELDALFLGILQTKIYQYPAKSLLPNLKYFKNFKTFETLHTLQRQLDFRDPMDFRGIHRNCQRWCPENPPCLLRILFRHCQNSLRSSKGWHHLE